MADEKYVIQIDDKVATTIEPKIAGIGKASKASFDALRQLQTMLNGLNVGGLTQLQNLLNQSANAMRNLTQAQTNLNTTNAQTQLVLQRVATEAQRTQIQMQNLTTAQHQSAAAALKTAQAAANLATAQNNAATAAQRLATEQQRTAQALTQAQTAATNGLTAQQKLAEAQTRAQKAVIDLATANQRLQTEVQRTAVQTQNAAAAADRARLAALQLAQAQNQVQNASSGAANSLLTYAKAAALAIGTAMGADGILKTADAYTVMQNKLVNVATSQEAVNLLTGKMFELSNRTGQSVQATTSAFQKFDNAMSQMGRGQEETLRLIETLNKATVVSGATTSEAASGILQLGQAFGSGRLQGDEFRSIMENLPVVADLVAKSMGKTRGELKLLSTQGKITAEELRLAFERGAVEIDAKFGKTTFTLAQNFQILNNNFTQWVGELNKSVGLTSTLSGWVRTLGNNLDIAAVSLAIFSSLLLVAFGPALIGMLATATKALLGFSLALAANPIGLLIVGITTAAALIAAFGNDITITSDKFVTLKDAAMAALSFIDDGFRATINFIKTAWSLAIDFVNDHTDGMGEKFRDIFSLILDMSKTNTNFLIGLFVGSFNAITKYWSLLPSVMKAVFNNVVNYGMDAVETLANAWQLGVKAISKIAGYVAPSMADSLNKALDSLTIHMPRMEVGTGVKDMAAEIGKEFTDAFTKDYVGSAADAFMKRAHDMAVNRVGINTGPGELRGDTGATAPNVIDPKAAKLAEKRAMALAKINGELNKQISTMFTLNPQRTIDQQFDEIQIQLASKKIKLTDGETESLKNKIAQINNSKQLQQSYDAIYEDSIKVNRDYNNTLQAAIMLLDAGSISSKHYQETVDKAIESHSNALDPMRSFNMGIKDQLAILSKIGPAQDIERQVLQRQNELRAEGKTLTDEQTASMRDQLTVVQQATLANDLLNGFYNTSIGKQKELAATGKAVADAHNLGYLSAEQYSIKLNQLAVDTANLKMQMGDATWVDSFTASLGQITSGFDGVMSGVSKSFGDFFTSFTDGFANSVGQAVVTSDSLGEALHNVANQAVAGLISALVKLGVQYAVNAVMGTAINATALTAATTASVAAAGVTAVAWAPAAALASLASFGANSVPAMAGITATTLLSEGIALAAAVPGFESGGYTGGGGTSDVAGVVHGQEFVMNARATAQNRSVLEAMNAGRNIPGSVSTINNTTSNGSQMNVSIINNMGESAEVTTNQLTEQDVEIIINKKVPALMASEANRANSPYNKTMNNNYAMQKRA